jgi:hypothetical protein
MVSMNMKGKGSKYAFGSTKVFQVVVGMWQCTLCGVFSCSTVFVKVTLTHVPWTKPRRFERMPFKKC